MSYVHFLYLHKENEPKESAAGHLVDLWSTALRCSQRTGDIGMTLTLLTESLIRSLLCCSAA
jgi:hypothetical protein